MPTTAQMHRVHDDNLAEPADTEPEDLAVCAFSTFDHPRSDWASCRNWGGSFARSAPNC
jgi:hypothetical protein